MGTRYYPSGVLEVKQMGKGRPGGNPDLVKYQFQIKNSERTEPLKAKLSMRITQSMKDELEEYDNWQELVREAIQRELDVRKQQRPEKYSSHQ